MISLRVSRRGRPVFDDVSLSLGAGQALRVEGPNGSGKSTFLKAVAGLLAPDAGSVRWVDEDGGDGVGQRRASTLYIGHRAALRDDLSAAENLRLSLALSGHAARPGELDDAARTWGLGEVWHRHARELSAGQRRRVALARLSVSFRPLWLLDEPSAALDRHGIATLRDAMTTQLARGGIVVYAAHDEFAAHRGDTACLRLEPSRAFH
ncbi:MAG TPA: heme ABC exporter ATP-binding protein CcmA [Burkholderiaceae bacterium]|nr:heme ABC exporter ATP-binding protein CcmA [Burkholderiaceae bacterium]